MKRKQIFILLLTDAYGLRAIMPYKGWVRRTKVKDDDGYRCDGLIIEIPFRFGYSTVDYQHLTESKEFPNVQPLPIFINKSIDKQVKGMLLEK